MGIPAQAAFVGYNPAAPTSNFGAPTALNNNVAYNTSVSSDSTYVHFKVTADPASGGAINGLNFANLYICTDVVAGTGYGSELGFEVGNGRAFKPGSPGYYTSSISSFTVAITASTVDLFVPWSYFTDDPDAIGFTKITAANNILRLNLSQAFGYSVAGGQANYGSDRLGTAVYSADTTPVPEPSTYIAGALLLLPFGAQTLRHLRSRKQVS